MNFLSNLLRNVLVLILALAGLAMAFVLMASGAIALGVMYVVARVRGKPFAPAAFWQARRSGMRWQFVRPGAAAPGATAPGAAAPGSSPFSTRQQAEDMPSTGRQFQRRPVRNLNVTDVEARDVS